MVNGSRCTGAKWWRPSRWDRNGCSISSDENPSFEFRSISYTNDPFVVAQNEKMVAINSALQVDLTGQVCADSLGTKPYSGFGGQIDFIRGAARSKGGVPIIALAFDGAARAACRELCRYWSRARAW